MKIIKIRNKSGDITTNLTEIKMDYKRIQLIVIMITN